MRRSLALLALLLGIGSAEAREGFPYNQHLNLEYSVEGSFPISNSSSAVIQSDSNHAYGRADINILFGMVKKSMEFEVNFNDTCNTEDGNKINVPEGYMGLVEGLFDYMSHLKISENMEFMKYNLFVTGHKMEVAVYSGLISKDLVTVRVIPLNEEYLVNRWDFKIRDLIVTFKDGLPISAYSKTLYIPVLGEHKKVSAKLKE